jgi:hypothetical protein
VAEPVVDDVLPPVVALVVVAPVALPVEPPPSLEPPLPGAKRSLFVDSPQASHTAPNPATTHQAMRM